MINRLQDGVFNRTNLINVKERILNKLNHDNTLDEISSHLSEREIRYARKWYAKRMASLDKDLVEYGRNLFNLTAENVIATYPYERMPSLITMVMEYNDTIVSGFVNELELNLLNALLNQRRVRCDSVYKRVRRPTRARTKRQFAMPMPPIVAYPVHRLKKYKAKD